MTGTMKRGSAKNIGRRRAETAGSMKQGMPPKKASPAYRRMGSQRTPEGAADSAKAAAEPARKLAEFCQSMNGYCLACPLAKATQMCTVPPQRWRLSGSGTGGDR